VLVVKNLFYNQVFLQLLKLVKAIALMKNFKRAPKLKKSQKEKILQLFLLSIILTIGEIKFSSSLVLAQSNAVGIVFSESNKVASITSTYEDSGNPNVEINTTSNNIFIKDLTINNNDLLFEDDLIETDIFLINSAWDILLKPDF
jgi:hypothetical protein